MLGRYAIERFFYRLGRSSMRDTFYALDRTDALACKGPRPFGRGLSSTIKEVEAITREICSTREDDGIVFDAESVEGARIKEDDEYDACFQFNLDANNIRESQLMKGSTTCTPAFAKSIRFRVATVRPWTIAVVAMRLSLIGMVFPVLRSRANSSAHFRPVSASQGRQWRRPAPASNQRSSAVRFFPLGRMRIPKRNSPRITGSTAMSGSCARSHSTTRRSGDFFVGSLKTLASTKYFTGYQSIQIR